MSIALDPTQIDLERGEVKEIITDDQAQRGIPYLVQINSDNGVRYAHDKRNAERGIELSGQQTHSLSNFRGSGIYVSAYDGPASLRVRPAGADLDSQPEQKVRITGGDLTLSSTVDVSSRSNRNLGNVQIEDIRDTVTVNVNDPIAQEATVSNIESKLSTLEAIQANGSGVNSFSQSVGTSSQTLQNLTVPDGKTLSLKADSDNGSNVLVDDTYPLTPGTGLTLSVNNANEIAVSSESGTQTIYAIVEG